MLHRVRSSTLFLSIQVERIQQVLRLELFEAPRSERRELHFKPPAELMPLHTNDPAGEKHLSTTNLDVRTLVHRLFRFEHRARRLDLFQIDSQINDSASRIISQRHEMRAEIALRVHKMSKIRGFPLPAMIGDIKNSGDCKILGCDGIMTV
jgi:hypothetical protein